MSVRGPRYEAKQRGLTRYFTGVPCKNGHVAERDAANGQCIACRLEKKAARRASVPGYRSMAQRSKYCRAPFKTCAGPCGRVLENTPEFFVWRTTKKWEGTSTECRDCRNARRREEEREASLNALRRKYNDPSWRERHRELWNQWAEANPGIVAFHSSKRRIGVAQATPPWVDRQAIAEIYSLAAQITKDTGIQHHVDHVYAINGKNSCGLHVPWNLEIVTEQYNLSKGNKTPDEHERYQGELATLTKSFISHHQVTMENDYGTISSNYLDPARAEAQAQKWREAFGAATVTIEPIYEAAE